MASRARIEANRRNALKSTGPRTAAGKDRAKFNALKHGYAAAKVPKFTDEMAELARGLWSGTEPDLSLVSLARLAVSADDEYRRVKLAQHMILSRINRDHNFNQSNELDLPQPFRDPYAPTVRALTEGMRWSVADRPTAAATAFQLERLDRYARRALSKRNKALRDITERISERHLEGKR